MGFFCGDCGDPQHTCAAWDGKWFPIKERDNSPNHNLVKSCPRDITTCEYRKEKIKRKED